MKKRAIFLLTIAMCFLLCNCAIVHGDKSGKSRCSETNLGGGSYSVRYQGKKHTTAEKAADLCLFRCAQLARENSYDYFRVVQTPEDSIVNTTEKSARSKTIKFLKEKTDGDDVMETNTVMETIANKYHLKIKDAGGSVHSSPWE